MYMIIVDLIIELQKNAIVLINLKKYLSIL